MTLKKDNWGNQELPGISNEELLSEDFAKKILYAEYAEKNRILATDPQWLDSVRAAAKRWSKDPEWIEAQAKRNEALVNSPEWPEIKARATETLKKRWKTDKEFRERMVAKNAEVTSSQEWLEAMRKSIAEANKRYWASPEAQAERSRIAKEAASSRDNAAIGEKHKQRFIDNPELRKESSKRSKQALACPEVKKKMVEAQQRNFLNPEFLKARDEGSKEYRAWLKTNEGKEFRSTQQKKNWENNRETMTQALKDRYTDGKLGKKISTALKNSIKLKESAQKRTNSIQTPDGIFESRKSAAAFYKIDPTAINRRMKKDPANYYYIDIGNGSTGYKNKNKETV
jgi:hypothetical protein